eukprot:5482388-Amphidinium_carterae.2
MNQTPGRVAIAVNVQRVTLGVRFSGADPATTGSADPKATTDEGSTDDSDAEEEAGAGGQGKKKDRLQGVQGVLAKLRGEKSQNKDDMLPMEKPRTWEMTMQLDGVVNVLTNKITTFFALSFRPADPETHRNHMHPEVLTMFTPSYTVVENGELRLDSPWPIHNRKRFTLSYKELSKHVLVVDMWQ